jgi:hypothetical protein
LKEENETMDKKPEPTAKNQAGPAGPKVKWVDTDMSTSYANVCNVASTREEVTLLFGTNQTWHNNQNEVSVRLSDRVILSPFAAKRLAVLLGNVIKEYERRFGSLGLEEAQVSPPASGGGSQ